MRVLVSGATSYLGRRLLAALQDSGSETFAIVRQTSVIDGLPGHVECFRLADESPTEALHDFVKSAAPDVFFHVASLFDVDPNPSNIAKMIDANVTLVTQVTDAMSRRGEAKVISLGSYFQDPENSPAPTCLYAALKTAAESILSYYASRPGVRCMTLRLTDVYGPNDPRPKLIPLLLEAAASGRPIDMTLGHQLVDLIHVDDVCDALLLAASQITSHRENGHDWFNIATNQRLSIRDLAALVEDVTGHEIHARWGAKSQSQYVPRNFLPRTNLLPGLKIRRAIRDGIVEAWNARKS